MACASGTLAIRKEGGEALARLAEPIPSRSKRSGVSCVAMNEELKPSSLETAPPEAVISGTSAEQASDLLFQLLLEGVRRHQPETEPVLLGGAKIIGFTPELMARARQTQGIWFQ